MNVKNLLLGVAVMLMAATESSNAFVKRALRKKQEDLSDEELDALMQLLTGLEEIAEGLEEAFSGMEPATRMLRKKQGGDAFDITQEEWNDLLTTLEQLEGMAKQFETGFGEKKRQRRR